MVKLMALAVFSGEMPNLDVDAAAKELDQAGYEVLRLPDKFALMIAENALAGGASHLLDNFIEAHRSFEPAPDFNLGRTIVTVMEEVDEIAGKYGGLCAKCGEIDEHHIPFAGVFALPG